MIVAVGLRLPDVLRLIEGAASADLPMRPAKNTCFGTRAKVQQHVGQFFRDIVQRTDEVKRRCRRTLRAQTDALTPIIDAILHQPDHVNPTAALV